MGNGNNGQERCLSPRPGAAVAFTQDSQPEAFTGVLFDWPAFLRKVLAFSIPLGILVLRQQLSTMSKTWTEDPRLKCYQCNRVVASSV